LNFERDVSLAKFTTLQVGGPADFFVRVETVSELREAFQFAQDKSLPTFMLGGGSNLLFADAGFRGLVIRNEIGQVEFAGNLLKAGSGISLAALVMESARRGLAGLENFAGIPGSVGAAVCGNASGIGEKIAQVKILEGEAEKIIPQKDLTFAYRDSNLRGQIITELEFELKETDEDLSKKVSDLAREKALKQPFEKTAGSWFKNPSLAKTSEGESSQMKAWELIEQAGCRDLRAGDAVISERHANFFQNSGSARAADFLALEKIVSAKVEKKFGVKLKREVVVVESGG